MISSYRYIAGRLFQVIPTTFIIVLFTFVLLQVAPGDMVDVIAGESGSATPEYMAELRSLYGLDVPPYVQFWHYIQNLVQFDLGYSFRENMPISELIVDRLPATLLLSVTAITFALVFGLLLGVLAAKYRGSPLDSIISVISTIGFATPLFWIGLMLIVLFSIHLRWLPVAGMATVAARYDTVFDHVLDVCRHLALPALSLGFFYLSMYVRITRSAMLEIYSLDFVRTARAKGLSEWRVVTRHILRNALLPVVTITGLELGGLFGGTVVIETVFSWPGIGRLAYDAVFSRDLNLLLGIFLCSAVLVILMNLVVDLLYAALDPRIEIAA